MEAAYQSVQQQQNKKASLDEERRRIDELQTRILNVTARRKRLHRRMRKQEKILQHLEQQYNDQSIQQQEKLLEFRSIALRNRHAQEFLDTSDQWNAIDDAFHIQTKGPFATINNLRLGDEALILSQKYASTPLANDSTKHGTGSSAPGGGTLIPTNHPSTTPRRAIFGEQIAQQHLDPTVKVPWSEINAALGQIALLLVVLQERKVAGIQYRHEILPRGNKSTIATYPLFHEDGFHLFGRRNFNIALQYLVECIIDAFTCIQRVDRTIIAPFAIERNKMNGSSSRVSSSTGSNEYTIGGLAITHGSDAQGWTRACKYLLINVKQLLLYRAATILA